MALLTNQKSSENFATGCKRGRTTDAKHEKTTDFKRGKPTITMGEIHTRSKK